MTTPDTVVLSTPAGLRRFLIGDARVSRLAAAISVLQQVFRHHQQPNDPGVRAAVATLAVASDALNQRDIGRGWSLVHRAERQAAAADTGEERVARAIRLREEAREKLSGWRQQAALEAIGEPAKATVAGVQTAMDMMSEHASNQYHKAELLTDQVLVIGRIALFILVAALGASYAGIGPLAGYTEALAWAVLLGALGGTLSAARGLTEGTSGKKIPDQVYSWPITLTRPLVGAAAGLGAFVLLLAGIVSVNAANSGLAGISVAFIAGFSERYFLSLVGSVEKRSGSN